MSKTRCFCVLFVVHAAQVLSRTVTLALLIATQPWWAAVYLGGDFLVLVVVKAARRDLVYCLPGCGVLISLLIRFCQKVFLDSTACAHFRHPLNLGGVYYALNAALGQATPIRPHTGDIPASIRAAAMVAKASFHRHARAYTRAHPRTRTSKQALARARSESRARTHTHTHTHMRTRAGTGLRPVPPSTALFDPYGWRRWRR